MPTVQQISHTFKRWSIRYFWVCRTHAVQCKYVKEVSVRCPALCYHLLPLPQHLLYTSLLASHLQPDITESISDNIRKCEKRRNSSVFVQSLHKLKVHRDGHTFSPIPVNVQTPMPLNTLKWHFLYRFYTQRWSYLSCFI